MNDDAMNKCQAVHCLMDMMKDAKDEFQVEALQIACRNILKRWSGKMKNRARRKFLKEGK